MKLHELGEALAEASPRITILDRTAFEAVDRDWGIRTILGVGPRLHYDVLSKEDRIRWR